MPKKKSPVVALVALVVPVLVIAAFAVLGGGSGGRSSSPPTTSGISSADAAADRAVAGPGAGTAAPHATVTTVTTTPVGSEAEATTSAPAGRDATGSEAAAEVASAPADAGPEGDRTAVTYPQPEVPAAGCRGGSGTAVLELRTTPSSGCLRVASDQTLVIRNRTGREISLVSIALNEVVAPGNEVRLGRAGDAFGTGRSIIWSPGNPKLSTIIEVA